MRTVLEHVPFYLGTNCIRASRKLTWKLNVGLIITNRATMRGKRRTPIRKRIKKKKPGMGSVTGRHRKKRGKRRKRRTMSAINCCDGSSAQQQHQDTCLKRSNQSWKPNDPLEDSANMRI